MDDFPLTAYEWNEWLDELEEFAIKRVTPKSSRAFYPIILYDSLLLFDKDDFDAAMSKPYGMPEGYEAIK